MGEPKRNEAMKSITVRVTEEIFSRLEGKRFAEKTSFQAVGEAFFSQWLEGQEVPPAPHRDPDLAAMGEWVERLIAIPEKQLQDYERAASTILRWAWEQEKINREK